MEFDFALSVGSKQHTNCFNFHQIYQVSDNRQQKRVTIYDMKTSIVKPITLDNNQYHGILQLTPSDANQIRAMERLLEKSIRTQLDNPEYTLKSEVFQNHQLPFRLPVIRGQITTKITKNQRGRSMYVGYHELSTSDQLAVTLKIDNVWSRDDCYGSFLYKWKPIKIEVT
jgi:hypothetical protein